MAEGGNRPEYVEREHPCKLCYVRAITRRALITHYLRKHGKGLDYGSDWPRDLEEDDYQKRMMRLKRGQKNSYDRRHGRTGDPLIRHPTMGRRLSQTVLGSCTVPGIHECYAEAVPGSVQSLSPQSHEFRLHRTST